MRSMFLNVDCMDEIWKACLSLAEPRVIQIHLDYEPLGYCDEMGVKVPNDLIENPDPNSNNAWQYNPNIGYEWGWNRDPDWDTAVIKTLTPPPTLLSVCHRSRVLALAKYNLRVDALRKECYIHIDPLIDILYIRQNPVAGKDQWHLVQGNGFKEEVRDKIRLMAIDATTTEASFIKPGAFKSLVEVTATGHYSFKGCFQRMETLFKERLEIVPTIAPTSDTMVGEMLERLELENLVTWPDCTVKFKEGQLTRDGVVCCIEHENHWEVDEDVLYQYGEDLEEWGANFSQLCNPSRNRDVHFWESVYEEFGERPEGFTISRPRRRCAKYASPAWENYPQPNLAPPPHIPPPEPPMAATHGRRYSF